MEKVIPFSFIETKILPKFSEEELKEIRNKFNEFLKDYAGVSFMICVDTCIVSKMAWDSAIEKVLMSRQLKKAIESPHTEASIGEVRVDELRL